MPDELDGRSSRRHPPALNVPPVVVLLLLSFFLVEIGRAVLDPLQDMVVLVDFSFIPGCYSGGNAELCDLRAVGAGLWSPLTYAFLHGGWAHLLTNTVWMLAFGTPVARRLGAVRFLVLSALGSVAGAAAFALFNPQLMEPVVGASGVVSALMGAACRFAFQRSRVRGTQIVDDGPRLGIMQALSDRTVLFFVIFFFVINLVVGTGVGSLLVGGDAEVAWEAHLGGFVFGFLTFALFDRQPSPPGEEGLKSDEI
ncbi:rhomboid family intramembrane serine protease [Consotaella salsifontis]|uniref:Membrane associated serine protease, rhomboid family n=1 Tax=Consotaella salsifontis TaxID=1365950 RepID=A0A1T4L7K8_9HYPH|nr:rhomboid family intramembrane serine protease [Consotaella salsifontis]SJZ50608.1 Membrane associated serine protease, rhomboid family [Consotaella salsifontis]